MKFSHAQITQEMEEQFSAGRSIVELSTGNKDGYKACLLHSYMKEVADFTFTGNQIRCILVTDKPFLARQACLCLLNRFLRRDAETGYEALYEQLDEELSDDEIDISENLKVFTNQFLQTIFEVNKKDGETSNISSIESSISVYKDSNIMFEVEENYPADVLVHGILKQTSQCVAVMLTPGKSSEYLIRRLCFEGNYKVINIGTPEIEDYLSYGESYLKYHEYFLEANLKLDKLIEELQAFRGALFTEIDIYTQLEKGMEKAFNRNQTTILSRDVTLPWTNGNISASAQLDEMVGLEKAKNTIRRMVALKKTIRTQAIHSNMIFAGNPGTGKSQLARIYAQLLAEVGISNGNFLDVCRSDLIGQYVGHTAPKVRKAFEQAKGGVLFVDEASFLNAKETFVQEAVVEFVRFMELYPQTTVIFATYKNEAEQLLDIDSGFRSRISKIVCFEDYDNEELFSIMEVFARHMGVTIDKSCKSAMEEYVSQIRGENNFANAREIRKLVEASIEEYGLREEKSKKRLITQFDMSNASSYLLNQRVIQPRRTIGFATTI